MKLYVVTTKDPMKIVTPEFRAVKIGKMQFLYLLYTRYNIIENEQHPLFFITEDEELCRTITSGRGFDFEFSKWTQVTISDDEYTKRMEHFVNRNMGALLNVWIRIIGDDMYCIYPCLEANFPIRKDFLSALLFDLVEMNKKMRGESAMFTSVNFCVHEGDVGTDSNIPILGEEIFKNTKGVLDYYSINRSVNIEKLRTFHHRGPCIGTLINLRLKNEQEFQDAFLDIFDTSKKSEEWINFFSNSNL